MSRVGMSHVNVSVGGETEETVTILVRGAYVSMEHCDMRLLAPVPASSKQKQTCKSSTAVTLSRFEPTAI